MFNKDLDWSVPMFIGGVLSLLLISTKVNATEQCQFLEELSPYQYDIAYQAYKVGSEHDLGLTSVAIAWKESKLGKYKVRYNRDNIKDVSVGVFHTVAYWKTKGMSAFESGVWFEGMLQNDAKSIDVGVKDILYWQSRANGGSKNLDWFTGVAMYNGGNSPNYEYAKDIVNIVKTLKDCKFN